jgi:hypothetical protein
MDIVKKNLLSIICGVVALVAIVALFYPLGGTVDRLKGELDSRKAVYATLEGLRSKPRTLPVIDPDKPTPEPLGRFPNDQIIEQGKAIPDAFAKEANNIVEEAKRMNIHQPLVPGSLPVPTSSTYSLTFRDQYREMVTEVPLGPAAGLRRMLKAGYPPTNEEIAEAQKRVWNADFAPMLVIINGQARNQAQVEQLFRQRSLEIPREERQRVANESMVYIDPPPQHPWAISQAPSLNPTGQPGAAQPTPMDIWFAQLQLWIQEDVIKAILRTNGGFKNVTEAPVKHLVKIEIPQNVYVLPSTYAAGTEITGDPKAAVPKEPLVSATGRLCNPLYDVVRFDVTLNIEADRLPWFLKELGNGHFVTVTNMDVKSVDLGVQRSLGFIYGDKPVVQVKLTCEQLFLHDWSRPLMPKEVATNMGQGAVPGQSGPMMGAPEDMMMPRF